jgi:hypothetical protein
LADEFSKQLPFGLSDLPSEPLGPEINDRSANDVWALRIRGTAKGSDVVNRLDSLPAVAWSPSFASVLMQMAPRGGITDALGGLPDFERGGFYPSAFANLRNGNYGDAGWQMLGTLGDGMYMTGPYGAAAGMVAKSKRATDLWKRTARTNLFDDLEHLQPRQGIAQSDLPRALPPRGIRDRTFDLINNTDVAKVMKDKIRAGLEAGAANWYNTEPLRQAFVKELGSAEGEAAYNRFLNYVAASSPLSSVGESIRNASYYYGRTMRNQGLPVVGEVNPPGYRHFRSDLHQRLLRQLEERGFDPDLQAKVLSFAENLRGNQLPVTVDMHAFRLPAMLADDYRFLKAKHRAFIDEITDLEKRQAAIKDLMKKAHDNPSMWDQVRHNEYAAIEQLYQRLARELGVTPAQAQAAAWLAGAEKTGLKSGGLKPDDLKSFMAYFDNRVARTAREKGVLPEDVLREFIRGRMNLVLVDDPTSSIA